jgi:hypothetical protein
MAELAARLRARRGRRVRVRPFVVVAVCIAILGVGDVITQRLAIDGGTRLAFAPVTLIRLVGPLVILRFPIIGLFFSTQLDKWDWHWLGIADDIERLEPAYQVWDKLLDTYYLAVLVPVVLRWEDRYVRWMALATFAWRAAGTAALVFTTESPLLVLFPNLMESLVFFYLVYELITGRAVMLRNATEAWLLFAVLLIPKVGQEYFMHAAGELPWKRYNLLPDAFAGERIEALLWVGLRMLLPGIAALLLFGRVARESRTARSIGRNRAARVEG